MASPYSTDSILKGRPTDPAVREGIGLVDYPGYLISAVLEGDGLREVHARISGDSLTPEGAARIITAMVVEHLAEDIPASSPAPAPQKPPRSKPAFVAHFPKPAIRKVFGKRPPGPPEPVFEDNPPSVDYDSSITASLILRAEAVTSLWRQGRLTSDQAAHLLAESVRDHQQRKQK